MTSLPYCAACGHAVRVTPLGMLRLCARCLRRVLAALVWPVAIEVRGAA